MVVSVKQRSYIVKPAIERLQDVEKKRSGTDIRIKQLTCELGGRETVDRLEPPTLPSASRDALNLLI
jgi:hypothetical protein